ncbi:hypothetical protein HEK616_34500 [Streptomyces nigrescens]|uniref:Uncharacterized protein n=2 Tax=Streptomyces TaxID=1883 RepID=A0ABM7ZUV4_STRNI|nr:hypothetical protein [Streptomyces nigrescens]MEE4422449.1 hypothetical protein [Streptomyces sp. DSM 41528]BDM69963.1 hypothetical protein HEK616_34500 [Streptomyces nigrescens]
MTGHLTDHRDRQRVGATFPPRSAKVTGTQSAPARMTTHLSDVDGMHAFFV